MFGYGEPRAMPIGRRRGLMKLEALWPELKAHLNDVRAGRARLDAPAGGGGPQAALEVPCAWSDCHVAPETA
jgi:hypothetical protein